jgi:hypothetical protein
VSSKNERLDITMRLLGARQMETEGKKGEKSVEGVGKATKRTSRETTKASKATGVLTKSYGQLGKAARYGIGFLGVGGVLALESAVENTQELSKVTTGLNRNLGLSIQGGSRWAAVAHARGIASTALNMSFTKLGKSFVEANRKGGTARTALNQLGITYNQTSRGAHDFNYALELVTKKFGEAGAGPKRQSAAMALLGKGYSTVLPLMSSGTEGLKEQLHWADKYGVTLDGKTNDALMNMVTAQRESKVAMLGLQVTMTKAAMPAIEAGEEQLHKFIATLNDPDMSGAEKITAIQHQFEDIEDTLIKVISDALPKVAEHAGQLGVKMAEAVWEGFKHSNVVGKLVIAAWIFNMLGGEALVKAGALRVGGMIGTTMGLGLALGAVGAFLGYEIYEHMSAGTKIAIRRWGTDAGEWFVNGMISVLNTGIREINDALDAGNVFSVLGVDAPNISEIGGVNLHGDQHQQNEEAQQHVKEGLIDGPGGKPVKPYQPGGGKKKGQHSDGKERRRDRALALPVQHIHLHWNGKEVATGVLQVGEDAAALR